MHDFDDYFFRCVQRMLNKVITNCGLIHLMIVNIRETWSCEIYSFYLFLYCSVNHWALLLYDKLLIDRLWRSYVNNENLSFNKYVLSFILFVYTYTLGFYSFIYIYVYVYIYIYVYVYILYIYIYIYMYVCIYFIYIYVCIYI